MATTRQFSCKQCGADLKFEPGTRFLTCPYCGAKYKITGVKKHQSRSHLAELNYKAYLDKAAQQNLQEIRTVSTVS